MTIAGKTGLVLLPGWVLGPRPLVPLSRAIERCDSTIEVHRTVYPRWQHHRLEAWLEILDETLPDNVWLGGWSMGGMLAAALAERRGARTPGLITMGASARAVFPAQMASDMAGPVAWPSLLAQGRHDVWHLGRRLLAALPNNGVRQSAAEFLLLMGMDLCRTLSRLEMPQLHLFGEQDMLIPPAARRRVSECLPATGQIQLMTGAGHGFVIDQAEETARVITGFMTAHCQNDASIKDTGSVQT
ncbi:pimeloyl-[acyl-carrier protein] methyl ester esterase [Kushneria avicenniae]|uniref:Pimeloyl-[acyl-carrier protein] methyl ester esterase n=1 Tax=Kushneria avicenniae TaxID=402385 RepID=A0A1I1GJ47_9GAMM|nr:alpha/beta hydrolase [Kushneria avicenniae]SFC11475.1 pimeloyl-[acyl-carrier protein] methyl ester esterase [Kushneria avicenniae]